MRYERCMSAVSIKRSEEANHLSIEDDDIVTQLFACDRPKERCASVIDGEGWLDRREYCLQLTS